MQPTGNHLLHYCFLILNHSCTRYSETKAAESSSSQPRNKGDKEKKTRRDDGGRGGRGKDRPNQHNNAGRGQWVMPTGAAFFTGNASTALAKTVNSTISIPVKAETTGRIARPNEIIEDILPAVSGDKKPLPKGASEIDLTDNNSNKDFEPYVPMEPEDIDSDASMQEGDDDVDNNGVLGVEGLEVWPPKKYDPYAPLSLPFGPKTATMRKILAAQVSSMRTFNCRNVIEIM